jgi:hypothetical protein
MSVSYSFPGRRRRSWVSHIIVGYYNGIIAHAVYRCPVVRGVPMVHLSWLHKIVPAS